jgi:hypothetical protein
MFKALFGSFIGKIATLALLVVGVLGGMSVTGDVPSLASLVSDPGVLADSSGQPPAVTLDFPTSVLAKPAPPVPAQAAPAPAAEVIIEEIVASQPVLAPPPAPPSCVAQLQGLVNNLVGVVQTITTPQQAQDVLTQAASIGESSKGCAAQAAAAGNLGLDQIGKLTEQLVGVVGQVQALPLLAPPGGVNALANPVQSVVDLTGKGLEMTLGVVNEGLGALLSPLN